MADRKNRWFAKQVKDEEDKLEKQIGNTYIFTLINLVV